MIEKSKFLAISFQNYLSSEEDSESSDDDDDDDDFFGDSDTDDGATSAKQTSNNITAQPQRKQRQLIFLPRGGARLAEINPDGATGLRRRRLHQISVGRGTHTQQRAKRHTINHKLMKFREQVMAGRSTYELLKIHTAMNEQRQRQRQRALAASTLSHDMKNIAPKTVQIIV